MSEMRTDRAQALAWCLAHPGEWFKMEPAKKVHFTQRMYEPEFSRRSKRREDGRYDQWLRYDETGAAHGDDVTSRDNATATGKRIRAYVLYDDHEIVAISCVGCMTALDPITAPVTDKGAVFCSRCNMVCK